MLGCGMVNRDLVMSVLSQQHLPETKLTLLAISDIGLHGIKQNVCKQCYEK